MKFLTTAALALCLGLVGCSSTDKKATTAPVSLKKPKPDIAWMDSYEARLKEALAGSNLEVTRRESTIVVIAPVEGAFHPARPSMLLPVTLGPLTKIAKLVEGDPKTVVVVLGHADSSGPEARNRELSRERAGSVASIFRLTGLRGNRLMVRGVGSDMPRAANDTVEGRTLNRRVEMVLAPQATMQVLLARLGPPEGVKAAAPARNVAAVELPKGKKK